MKFEFSAGGVVYKRENGKTLILVCRHSYHHGWVFPKGLIGDKHENESKEETAVREVKEETGIDAEIEKNIPTVEYFYQKDKEKVKKTVYYYVMRFLGGDINDHDNEMEEVEWIDYNDVPERLSFASDKKSWEAARRAINRRLKVSTTADHPQDDKE